MTQLIPTRIILKVLKTNNMTTTCNMRILKSLNREGVYGIILLCHALLTKTAGAEGMVTECREIILPESADLSVKATEII